MKKNTTGIGEYTKPGYVTKDARYMYLAKQLIEKAFPQSDSERINQQIQGIEIKNIYLQPSAYIMLQGFYEQRAIEEEHLPSGFVPGLSERRHSKGEYPKWDVDLGVQIKPFQSTARKIVIPGSRHIDECGSCGTAGWVACSCRDGYETCSSCRGRGDVRCGSCGGSGSEKCGYCYGSGTIWTQETYYDEHNLPAYRDVAKYCYHCQGSGQITCNTCGGSGSLVCGRCRGTGTLICSKCNGSRRVTCGSCRGGGYFLNQVYVDLKSDSFTVYDVFDHADTLPGEFTSLVGEPEPSDLDRRIIRVEDTEPINAIHSEKLFASGELDSSYLLDQLMEQCPEDNDMHYRNFAVEIRERDIVDVFYTFGGKEYRLRADPIKDVIVFEHNPYEEFADSLIEELEDAYQTKHFKTLKKGMDDYETARADSVEPADERVEKLRKSLDRHVLLIALIAPFILLLISIVRYPMLLFQIRFYALGIICAGLCVVAVRKIWRYIVSDIRFLTEGIAILLSGLIFYGLNWLIGMVF